MREVDDEAERLAASNSWQARCCRLLGLGCP